MKVKVIHNYRNGVFFTILDNFIYHHTSFISIQTNKPYIKKSGKIIFKTYIL